MSGIPHPELEHTRSQFPILEKRTYLNSCSLGALSLRSIAYLNEYQKLWNTMGASAWYELWLGRLSELRGRVAQLWGAEIEEVALLPSVSAALSIVASAIDHSRRDRVVVADLDFPTQIYQWMVKPDVELVRVPSDDGIGIDPARWGDAVDERVAAIATSHVFYSTGHIQDLAPVAAAARENDALFIVDGYQAAGQIPVNPRELGADVYVSGPLKWLLGGPGMAFLWVRSERIGELVPTMASWFGARDQFEFAHDRFEFRADAARFELGTPALPTAYTALGGLEVILDAGAGRIRERNAALTERLVLRLRDAGFVLRISDDPERRSAIVMVRLPTAREAVAALAQDGIIVDTRGEYVRVSPHFYNTPAEIDLFVDALQAKAGAARS